MNRFFYGIAEDEENTATLVKALDGRCYSEEVIERMNKPVFRRCCNPSTCTMSNALSIARHYAALDTCTLLTRETIDNATILRRAEDDMIPIEPGRWELFGLGYVLSGPKDDLGRIFGHGGVGGSEGLLDRKQHFAIGYTRNLFADPNGRNEFLKLIGLKNRDW